MKKIIITLIIILVIYIIKSYTTELDDDKHIVIPGTDIENPVENIEFNNDLEKIIYTNRKKSDNKIYKIATNKDEFQSRVAFDVLKIKYDDVKKFAISMSKLKIDAYCVGIILPIQGKKQDILNSLKTYKDTKINYFSNKLKTQLIIAENTVVTYYRDYVIIIMCDENIKLFDNFRKELRKK